MSHDKIITTFDGWADSGRADGLEQGHGNVVSQVLKRIEVRAGMQSLDLGCGTGWATRILAAKAPGAGAIGIDASPSMVRRAEKLHDLTSRARYEVGTFEAIDYKDGKFDRVFSMEALYYAVDLSKAIAEVFRVLKPGGQAHIMIDRFEESPHTECWAELVSLDMAWLGEAAWKAAFESAGFQSVATERVIDSRGPGDEASFEPSKHYPDWQTRVELHAAGTLYIQAEKPE